MKINHPTVVVLFGVVAISLMGVTATKPPGFLYSIFMALLVSSIFYSATVLIPEIQKRRRLKKGLQREYLSFKRSCIDIFLIMAESQDYRHRDSLLNHKEFKRYFSVATRRDQNRWGLVATCIDDGDYLFDKLVSELEYLMREVDFVRANIELFDEEVENFFRTLFKVIHQIKASKPGTDDFKYFCRTLWGIFTRWDLMEGQLEEDFIDTFIERI